MATRKRIHKIPPRKNDSRLSQHHRWHNLRGSYVRQEQNGGSQGDQADEVVKGQVFEVHPRRHFELGLPEGAREEGVWGEEGVGVPEEVDGGVEQGEEIWLWVQDQ